MNKASRQLFGADEKSRSEYEPRYKRLKVENDSDTDDEALSSTIMYIYKAKVGADETAKTTMNMKTVRIDKEQDEKADFSKKGGKVETLINGVESWSLTGLKQWRNEVAAESRASIQNLPYTKRVGQNGSINTTKRDTTALVRQKQKEARRQLRMLRDKQGKSDSL